MTQDVTFYLHMQCNRSCVYCCDIPFRPWPEFTDDEMLSRFDTLVSHVEKLTGGNFAPSIIGGEPTLWSDYMVNGILDRLSGHGRITVLTNHSIRTSAWEGNPRVFFITHLTDWEGKGRVAANANEALKIVVTHDSIGRLEPFMRANFDHMIGISEYFGEDERFILTDEDKEKLFELESKYPRVEPQLLFQRKLLKGMDANECRELCRKEKRHIWQAHCARMRMTPCCGAGSFGVPYEEFDGSPPDSGFCEGCQQYSLWIRMR